MKMKKMTLAEITEAVGGEFIGPVDALEHTIKDITLDSRKVTEGCLFVAIKGERSDGHDYINTSLENGAVCALAEKPCDSQSGPCIRVDSTLRAIRALAEYYRKLFSDLIVIGITGSVGKTTTKEMVFSVLSEKFRVHKTSGNLNNEIGVPMTIFELREGHEAAVIEMGISDFGEMRRLSQMVRPDIVIMSIIGHSHLEFLGSREGVLAAKGEIFEYANPNGIVIVNGDDDLLREMSPARFAPSAGTIEKMSYGLREGNDIRAACVRDMGERGVGCRIDLPDSSINVYIPAFGNHMIYAALAGAAAGRAAGLDPDKIAAGIGKFQNVGKRAAIRNTGYITVIDDCYNANPDSVLSALESLSGLEGRKTAILGDMGELGGESGELHQMIGRSAAAAGIDCLISVGEKAEDIYRGSKSAGETVESWYFPEKSEFFCVLETLIHKGDIVLVKASRSMKFEDIVYELEGLRETQ